MKGRLDNYWTEHLRGNLEEVIRGGAHGIRLNLSEISFLSSAGVGLLVKFHTQLKGIGGSFVSHEPFRSLPVPNATNESFERELCHRRRRSELLIKSALHQ